MPRGPPGAAAARGPPGAGVHAGPAPAGTTPSVGVVPCGPHGRKNRSARARRGSAWGAGTPGLALAAHPLASAASVRPREAQRNPDASSFPAPPRARGTPVAAACGWPARGRGAGTARPPASAARAGPPAHRTGSRGSLGHRGGRCAPPPRTARTRTLAPRHPPPLWRPEGFTPPAARAILYPVIGQSLALPRPVTRRSGIRARTSTLSTLPCLPHLPRPRQSAPPSPPVGHF
jgi:hypothetical protein